MHSSRWPQSSRVGKIRDRIKRSWTNTGMTTGAAHIRVRRPRVLLLGEGNFSFAQAYAVQHPESEIFATSFDSEIDVRTKYPEALSCLEALSRHDHASLHYGIDATALSGTDFGLEFDLILFNHPHSGSEHLQRHQSLLSHFFHSARNVTDPEEGEIR